MIGTVKMSQYRAFHTKVCHTQQKGRQPGSEPVWLHEVSEAGTEAATVRAIVGEVLTIMDGLSRHTGDCPVGHSTYQCLNSPLRNTTTDRIATMGNHWTMGSWSGRWCEEGGAWSTWPLAVGLYTG